MSVAEAAHRPVRTGRAVALFVGFLIVIAAGIGLAWAGAGSLRPTVTASGLQFRTIKAGHGDPIGRADAAVLDYILTTDDGTVVDSSSNHQDTPPFYLDMPGLFPGFREAMTRMQEGGEYRFTMPQSLAFPNGAPPGFPKDSKLTFEVRVQKIGRGAADYVRMQMQQMQAQQQQQQQPSAPPQQ